MFRQGTWRGIPAYGAARTPALAVVRAGAANRAHPTFGLSSLGTRRQRFWFALLGIIALALPYSSAMLAAVRAAVNPPAVAVTLPALSIPQARFPRLAVPRLHAAGIPVAGAQAPTGASRHTVTTTTIARPGATQIVRMVRVRRTMRVVHVQRPRLMRIPVVSSSYGLPAPRGGAPAHHGSGAAAGSSQALAKAPIVTEGGPPVPAMPAPPPPVTTSVTPTPVATATPATTVASAPVAAVTQAADTTSVPVTHAKRAAAARKPA
ncbi:MAG TPA: hypothetical protein VGF15_04200, partial [Solirubrobacteraceae bacterium]